MVKGFSAFKAMEKNHTRGKMDRSGHISKKWTDLDTLLRKKSSYIKFKGKQPNY